MTPACDSFEWPVRVYYEDTDAAGVVYYANYLKYMERARTEFLRALGFEQDRLGTELGVVFVVRRLAIEYLVAARFNDMLTATLSIARARRASIEFDQQVLRGADVCASAQVQIACMQLASGRATGIPRTISEALA